jgi:glycosyltransferase involved in cell wall biosynthesis
MFPRFLREGRDCDLILLAEFCPTLTPLAWLLGRLTRKPVVFDYLISYYEANIHERKRHQPRSLAAWRYLWLDRISGRLPDALIVQTEAFARYLQEQIHLDPARFIITPLGVNDDLFHPIEKDAPEPLRDKLVILYFGNYIPNHGVDVILDAAALLRDDRRFWFRFIGDGERKAAAQAQADRLALDNVEFLPRVPFAELPRELDRADMILGVFGDTPQARQHMANKVTQGLAMRKFVLAGDTPSIHEHFTDRVHLWLVPLGDAQALADALREVSDLPGQREQIARQGYEAYRATLTPAVIGARLKADLEAVLAAFRTR